MYVIEITNESMPDYTIEVDTKCELKKMLECDILDYTECRSLRCLLPMCVDDIIANLEVLGEYDIDECNISQVYLTNMSY
jgi:hypothetical protein